MLSQQSHRGPIILDKVAIKDLQDQGYLFVHLLSEEYHHLEHYISTPHDLANEANIVTKVKHPDGSLRRPWQRLAMHQEVKDAITLSFWLMTEGRIWTDGTNKSCIIGFKPSMRSSFHQLLEIKGVSGFTRHHLAACYHFNPIEMHHQLQR